jgi:hypothetical protein
MQQQKRRAFPLAGNINLDTLQRVFFYLVRHTNASAALLFKSILFFLISYHSVAPASTGAS